jgi:hypothetical protein
MALPAEHTIARNVTLFQSFGHVTELVTHYTGPVERDRVLGHGLSPRRYQQIARRKHKEASSWESGVCLQGKP